MPALVINVDEPSAVHSLQPVTEKLDNSRAELDHCAEDGRTNGNGNARQESEEDESEDADSEEGESEDVVKEESVDVEVGQDHDNNGGEEEDEDEENDVDGEEEDDEEEEEPSLKYERMGGAINDLLKKDSASALTVSNKCLVCLMSTYSQCAHCGLMILGSRNAWWHRARVQSRWGAY